MIAGAKLDLSACFSADYGEARRRFLDAASHGDLQHFFNPNKGPNCEALATDTAWFGPSEARHVLVLNSATHGVEGFCGSGAQLDILWSGVERSLPSDTALLMVHALNPYGFAWLRRTTEEGVDLNRNGIDFSQQLPDNPGYTELADAFVPRTLGGSEYEESAQRLEAYRAQHGAQAFEQARSGGQYAHPEGIYYGGTAPTWSMHTLGAICEANHLAERESVAVIDYHSGLGPFGYGEPICGHRPGEPGQARCRAWYGASLGEPLLGTSSSLPIAGLTQYAWARAVGAQRLTFIALEFGTYAFDDGYTALRADHWLHAYGAVDWQNPSTSEIKRRLKEFYYPDTTDWKESVVLRSRQVVAQALAGLSR
jgi:Protein of unknown function (DUF2817)